MLSRLRLVSASNGVRTTAAAGGEGGSGGKARRWRGRGPHREWSAAQTGWRRGGNRGRARSLAPELRQQLLHRHQPLQVDQLE